MTSISRSPKSNDESSSGQEKSVVTKQIHSTGNRWTDMQLAVKVSSPFSPPIDHYTNLYFDITTTCPFYTCACAYTCCERKRISVWDDLKHLGEIPCARTSLLSVIASGFGIGVIRGINTRTFLYTLTFYISDSKLMGFFILQVYL